MIAAKKLKKNGPELTSELLKSSNYRRFLASATRGANFSELTRRAGFSSRSYIKEVIDGKKRIGAQSIPRFSKALSLTGPLNEYFKLLVRIEEEREAFDDHSKAQLQKRLNQVKERLKRKIEKPRLNASEHSVLLNSKSLRVYAALGSPEKGATLSEIQNRCGLTKIQCENILQAFAEKSIVTLEGSRYKIGQTNFDFSELGGEHAFGNVLAQTLKNLAQMAPTRYRSDKELFLYSTFTVNEADLPEIKKRLRETLIDFMDSRQVDDGDRVAQVFLSLFI
jgi:uncharacterized protein (TIGR02147 family)